LEYEVVPIPSALAGLLRNEQLAHEIMVNPDFKIEDKQQDGFAEVHTTTGRAGRGGGVPDKEEGR
jgi:hypothetical protein